jgi:hypothetical protein
MDWMNALQWPAMAITVAASWMVASSRTERRRSGFWLFLASNALWVTWGWHADAPALLVLQCCLLALNIRGALKNADTATADDAS